MEAADPCASLFCLTYQLFLFLHLTSPRMDMNIPPGPEGGSEDSPQQWSNFRVWASVIILLGFPGGSVVKTPPANEGDTGSIPGSGRFPEEGNGNLLQYSCLEHEQRNLAGYSPWGLKRVGHNWATKQQPIILLQEGNYLRDFVRGVPSTHFHWPSITWSVSPIKNSLFLGFAWWRNSYGRYTQQKRRSLIPIPNKCWR